MSSAIEHHNPVDEATAVVIRAAALNDVVDVDRDGDCLFHCFLQSLMLAPWLKDHELFRARIETVQDMREVICTFMRQNPAFFEKEHCGTIRAKVAWYFERPLDSVTWEEAMPLYCDIMERPSMWGGEPEMDAGAILLGVIVHMFVVPNRGGALSTARLNVSFYPLTKVKETPNERKQYTKFIFIHQNDHFLFVRPMQPAALRTAPAPPAPRRYTMSVNDDVISHLFRIIIAGTKNEQLDPLLAARAAAPWMAVSTAHRDACYAAEDVWKKLLARYFAGAPTLVNDNLRANFYALCCLSFEYKTGQRSLYTDGSHVSVKAFVIAAIDMSGEAMKKAHQSLRSDREFALTAARVNPTALEHIDPSLRADRGFVLEAISINHTAMESADPSLRANREFVLEAVSLTGAVVRYCTQELQYDRDVALAAVRTSGWVLEDLRHVFRSDREVVIAAVTHYGPALKYAHPSLRGNREVVLAAVRDNGKALKFAVKSLRADREVVLEAVESDGEALKHAAAPLRNDNKVVHAAVWNHGGALAFASKRLREDSGFVLGSMNYHHIAPVAKKRCNTHC